MSLSRNNNSRRTPLNYQLFIFVAGALSVLFVQHLLAVPSRDREQLPLDEKARVSFDTEQPSTLAWQREVACVRHNVDELNTLLPYIKGGPQQKSRFAHLRASGFTPKSVLDVGANAGDWTSFVHSAIWPDAKFLLLEATEMHRERLSASGFPFKIVVLADAERDVQWFSSLTGDPKQTGNSIYRENTEYYEEGVANVTVRRARTLDSVVAEANMGSFDFIKMDVQGAELDVLRGAPLTLARATFVQLELSIHRYNKGAPLIDEVIVFMHANGFVTYDVTELHYMAGGTLVQVDYLFARNTSQWVNVNKHWQ